MEENIPIVPVLPLWRNGLWLLWVVCEKSSKVQVEQPLFSKKSVFLTDVFNTVFALVFCCSLPIMLLPFTIQQESAYFPFFGKPQQE